jgi:hypothetical protein
MDSSDSNQKRQDARRRPLVLTNTAYAAAEWMFARLMRAARTMPGISDEE